MANKATRPKVGVSIIIIKYTKILIGKRKSSHGARTWAFTGGHLEYGESIEDCAKREVMEETGLLITNLHTGPYTNDIFTKENKHYITLFMLAEWENGQPQNCEPEKCEGWEWREWNNMPKPLFLPIENLIKQGFVPFIKDNKKN